MRNKLQTLYVYQIIREFHTFFYPKEKLATSFERINKIVCYRQTG